MANELGPEVMQRLARLGAQARLEQMEAERKAILQAFPDLIGARRGRKPGRRPGRRARVAKVAAAAPAAAPAIARAARKKRSHMSAAARKAQSERMKKLWAERRKAKARAAGKD